MISEVDIRDMSDYKQPKQLVYLASPYSKYPGGRSAAFMDACEMAAKLMNRGYNVFCPIAHSHSIEVTSFTDIKDGDWWLEQDFAILKKCDRLLVYKMPGWDVSYGVNAEITFAKNNNIPIDYLPYEVPAQQQAKAA